MDAAIQNIDDLRNEIARLKVVKIEQEVVLKAHFTTPAAIFHTITSLFKGNNTAGGPAIDAKGGIASLFGQPDIMSLLSRVVLPFVLNKTLFRKSNFIIKAAVGLLSQKASGFINEKSVTSVWDKIKALIPKKKAPKKKPSEYEAVLISNKSLS